MQTRWQDEPIESGAAQLDAQWDALEERTGRLNLLEGIAWGIMLAVPMWNGGIPYRLKQYIDIIHQPGLLFGLDPAKGYFGLLQGKRAVLALTSGAYSPAAASPGISSSTGMPLAAATARAGLSTPCCTISALARRSAR